MNGDTLHRKWRLLAASFADAPRADIFRDRLGEDFREALEILVGVLAGDLALPAAEIDRQHLEEVLHTFLPGRLQGRESYAPSMPDLLEDFLMHVSQEEGLTTAWEWTSTITEGRDGYAAALEDPDRPRFALPPRTPDRRPASKVGRNDPCPCDSGRKYKHCCLRLL